MGEQIREILELMKHFDDVEIQAVLAVRAAQREGKSRMEAYAAGNAVLEAAGRERVVPSEYTR